MLHDNLLILKESFTKLKDTGCFWATSPWAARALTNPLRTAERTPFRILEAGAGTGAVTAHILDAMHAGDQLTICELNPRFMETLRKNLAEHSGYTDHKANTTFFCKPIQELPEDQKFDLIVCALPFLNFDLKTVEEIFAKFLRLSSTQALMTYFEYMGIRPLSKILSPPKRRERMQAIDSYFHTACNPRKIEQKNIWLNLLPAHIYTLKMAG